MEVRHKYSSQVGEHTIQEESSGLVMRCNALQKSQCIADPVGSRGC